MSGHVGIIANDAGRYTMFPICLTQLRHPPNTGILWHLTSDRIIGRNAIARDALEAGSEWLLFLDDDHAFPGDILHRLLAHDHPIVGALYLQRQQPFGPIAYDRKDPDGTYHQVDLRNVDPDAGLIEVAACGTGGMLIRSEVLHAMPYPWFEHGRASEDMIFCDKARELGFPIYVDPNARMGHLSMSSCWPNHDGERWAVGFQLADGFSMVGEISDEPVKVEVEAAAPA